ncbi:hypothetical protein NW752_007647 [Fusarium irregulare]|uniref:Glutathione S-transferase n=1 Tax=Fusarium irregulare TaxID=2494466 RepID=A0A9W8PHT4_9HYPO|nr:hypothetical protein NW766_010057 [Fusarium irregulare]KAJ4013350.1 hypothetical protein NW752_007647 [Fusarium irregulare]
MDTAEKPTKPRLIYLAHSPSTQGVLWLLEELNVDYDITKFDRPVSTLQRGMKETHIQGHAPQLILPDGRVITQMSACMLYITQTYSTVPADRLREDYLISLAVGDIIARVGIKHLFYVLPTQVPFPLSSIVSLLGWGLNKGWLNEEVDNALQVVENELEGREYLMGGDLSRADIAIKMGVDLAVHPNMVDLNKYPRVKAWYERCEARPAWKRSLEVGIGYQLDWAVRYRESQTGPTWKLPVVALAGAFAVYAYFSGLN